MISASFIKSVQDIMRQDDGVDGDAQRLSQLVWMIFLKILDDTEQELELMNDDYVPAVPAEYQWRGWAGNDEGLTGDDLNSFVNNDLFPGLRKLSPKDANPRTLIVREAFEDSYNYMKNGILLRQVINKINSIDFNTQSDRHQFNDLYEKLLKDLQSAGNSGEYYTPRALTEFTVEMVESPAWRTCLRPRVRHWRLPNLHDRSRAQAGYNGGRRRAPTSLAARDRKETAATCAMPDEHDPPRCGYSDGHSSCEYSGTPSPRLRPF